MLPRPLGLVEHFDRHKGDLSDLNGNRLLRLIDNDGSLLLPLGPLLAERTGIKLVLVIGGALTLRLAATHESPGD